MKDNQDSINRREFIERSIKAGVSLAAVTAGTGMLYNRIKPGSISTDAHTTLPDFSVTPIPNKSLAVVKAPDRTTAVQTALLLMGGLSHFIKKGDRVLLKPNIAFASSPELGATTHPETITEVIKQCKLAGASKITVIDNPINDPAGCFFLSGIEEAVKKAGGDLLLPGLDLFENFTLQNGSLIKNWPILYKPVKEANKVIGIAPIKNHHRSGASMTMKNWYGLLGGRRNIFHQDINTIITELAMMYKPTLVILDGFTVMMSNGPTGGSISDLKQENTIIISSDQVAADAYGATLLNMKESDLPYLSMAQKAGVGTADYKSLNPIIKEVSV